MAFIRWDPLDGILGIQQPLDRRSSPPTGWVPPVDLFERDDSYVLIAEIPGLRRDDLQIEFHDDRLTIAGVRCEREAGSEQYHRIERGHGRFSRTFQLPHAVDVEHITADLSDGVLIVTVPKVAEPPARRIHVS
jgi:HSP20 family protein